MLQQLLQVVVSKILSDMVHGRRIQTEKDSLTRGFWLDLRSKRDITKRHLDEYTTGQYNYYDPLLSPKVSVVDLAPPVDWIREELPRSWRLNLHSFRFADYWIKQYQHNGDLDILRRLAEVSGDYIVNVWHGGRKVNKLEFVRSDVSVAARAAVFAFLINQSQNVQLDGQVISLIKSALMEHISYAKSDENYNSNNHGLFNDLHLLICLINHPEMDDARQVAEKVASRFITTFVERQISSEFVHLEHTPSYALLWLILGGKAKRIFEALNNAGFLCVSGMTENMSEVIELVKENLWWFIRPDGSLANLGDQGQVFAPDWLKSIEGECGKRSFVESGYSFYKSESSYAALIAAYHATKVDRKGYRAASHKQRDELSVLWSERAGNILIDSGLRAFDYGPERRYTYSKQSHNTLSFMPYDFMKGGILEYMDATFPYGSGTIEVSQHGGRDDVFVMAAEDPLLARHGIYHIRLLLYRPEKWLGIVDLVKLEKGARVEWNFHFDYPWKCIRHGLHQSLLKNGKHCISIDRTGSGEPNSPHFFLHRGDFDPLRGWMFAGDPVAVTTLRYIEWLERKVPHIRVNWMAYDSFQCKVTLRRVAVDGSRLFLSLDMKSDFGSEHVDKEIDLQSDAMISISSGGQGTIELMS